MIHHQNDIAILGHDLDSLRTFAQEHAGCLLSDERDDDSLPFRALVLATCEDLAEASSVAEVGLYLVCRRVFRGPETPCGVVGVFPMVRNPDLSHREADQHWRDIHAPLALVHHPFMASYLQLSVVHRFAGPEWDGFALCGGFKTPEDLRQRFYTSDESRQVIRNDVKTFAAPHKSPKPLIAHVEIDGERVGAPSS